MPSKAIVIGFGLVITIAFVVSLVEFLFRLRPKSYERMLQERPPQDGNGGGLTQENSDDLVEKLCRKGFSDIMVSGTARALRGETLFLSVRANYVYTRMTGFFAGTRYRRQWNMKGYRRPERWLTDAPRS